MNSPSSFNDVVVCPKCLGRLEYLKDGAQCVSCTTEYPRSISGTLDLRLWEIKNVEITIKVGPRYDMPEPIFGAIRSNPAAEVEFQDQDLPIHLTPEMASYIPKAHSMDSLCLDLGCGNGEYRAPLEKAGYKWVGFDYKHPKAPLWADAHALPFPDNSFDFVISLSVLEHIKHPPVMLREIRRILKPGGAYLGSVAYLVPFHDWVSYFNMTHHGVWSAMEDAGLETEFVFGDRHYQGIRALAKVGLFAGLSRNWAYAIVEPIVWLHRLYWIMRRWIGIPNSSKDWQSLLNTGAFVYRAKKPCLDQQ